MSEKILQLHTEKNIFWMLVAILFTCAAFYIYFINATVRNVVARQNLENEATQLSVAISSQEFKYLALRSQITLPLAYSLGFKDVSEKTFVSRTPASYVSVLSH